MSARETEAVERELREIIASLGYCTADASLEFMRLIPAEVKARAEQQAATIAELRPYLHHFDNCGVHGDPRIARPRCTCGLSATLERRGQ